MHYTTTPLETAKSQTQWTRLPLDKILLDFANEKD